MHQTDPRESASRDALPVRARGRPRDQAKHAAILDAAREIFYASGMRGLSIEAVARATGVSKVTIYAHFQDLPGLIRALVLDQRDHMTRALEDLPADPNALRQGLIELGLRLMGYLTSDAFITLQRLLAAQAVQHPWLGPIIHEEGAAATRDRLAAQLECAVSRGDLRPHDCTLAAEQLLGMWQGIQTTGLMIGGCPKPDEATLRHRIEQAVDLILSAQAPLTQAAGAKEPGA